MWHPHARLFHILLLMSVLFSLAGSGIWQSLAVVTKSTNTIMNLLMPEMPFQRHRKQMMKRPPHLDDSERLSFEKDNTCTSWWPVIDPSHCQKEKISSIHCINSMSVTICTLIFLFFIKHWSYSQFWSHDKTWWTLVAWPDEPVISKVLGDCWNVWTTRVQKLGCGVQ